MKIMIDMEIKETRSGKSLTIALEGELNSVTAPQFESFISEGLHDVESLTLDLANLTYLSSAGLRVLLVTRKVMEKRGSLVLTNVQPQVMSVFEITGFANILDIR